VPDPKLEVPDLSSSGIRLNLTPACEYVGRCIGNSGKTIVFADFEYPLLSRDTYWISTDKWETYFFGQLSRGIIVYVTTDDTSGSECCLQPSKVHRFRYKLKNFLHQCLQISMLGRMVSPFPRLPTPTLTHLSASKGSGEAITLIWCSEKYFYYD